jgi:hypothetical protein
MKKRHIVIDSLAVMLFVTNPAFGGKIYSYVDADGVRVYTDSPPRRVSIKMYSTDQPTTTKIYKFVDSKGVIHITDKPKNSRYKLFYQGGVSVPSFSRLTSRKKIAIRPSLIQNSSGFISISSMLMWVCSSVA